jgi:hypothetical protein
LLSIAVSPQPIYFPECAPFGASLIAYVANTLSQGAPGRGPLINQPFTEINPQPLLINGI